MKPTDLIKHQKDLATSLGITSDIVKALIELIVKGKIAKPSLLFKNSASKLAVTGNTNFTFIITAKGGYFFYGSQLPLGTIIKDTLSKIDKEIAKAKDAAKKVLEVKKFFLEQLLKLQTTKIQGFAMGSMKFKGEKDGYCNMLVKASVTVNGKIKKTNLAEKVNAIADTLVAKNGQKIKFIPIKEEGDVSDVVAVDAGDGDSNTDTEALKAEYKDIGTVYKAFKEGAKAAYEADPSSKDAIVAAAAEAKKVAAKIAKFLASAASNTDLADQVAKLTKIAAQIKTFRIAVKASADGLGAATSNSNLDKLSSNINTKVADLRSKYGPEIASIPGLASALEAIG